MALLCLLIEYEKIFKQIHTEIPKPTPEYFNGKLLNAFTDIGGEWYLNNMRNKKSPTNNPTLNNTQQEENDKLKCKLNVACDHWKYWKFQTHKKNWNMLCHLNAIQRRIHFVYPLIRSL